MIQGDSWVCWEGQAISSTEPNGSSLFSLNYAMNRSPSFCFGTLALGKRYRSHAALLAADLRQQSPETPLILLTDHPTEFSSFGNVVASYHKQQSVTCAHDKRFVIQQALAKFSTCIVVDADVRILGPIPLDLNWRPGMTCMSFTSAQKHLDSFSERQMGARTLLAKTADRLNLDIASPDLKFVQDYLFAITRDEGREQAFLNYWNRISILLELYGLFNAEEFTIGLAAAKAGLPLHLRGESLEQIHFFKNSLERSKIKAGDAPSSQILACLADHEQIEFSKTSILDRLAKRRRGYRRIQRLVQARITAWMGSDFYYR
ncbi:MAG: hypothetical protein ACKO7W_17335 [Elainella sp.]